jgi:SAM-dependent methyltransferase
VLEQVLAGMRTADLRMLHIAPEPFFRDYFAKRFGRYETADLEMAGVDHQVDLRKLPFENETYDVVFASHVLEHIRDDEQALSEIRRVLKADGMAILPVPIVAYETVEYPEPNPTEAYHVRAPGVDYFKKYERHFARVVRFSSELLPARYQPFIYEDRTRWPTRDMPLRPAMQGERHTDVVPVCYVSERNGSYASR